MPDHTEQLEQLQSKLDGIRELDISHDDLGSANGFHEAESAKADACDYLIDILERLTVHSNNLNETVIKEKMTQIEQGLSQIQKQIEQADKLAASGVHTQNFPNQRKSSIAALKKHASDLKKQLHPLELDLKLCEINAKLEDPEYFSNAKREADAALGQINKALAAAQSKTVQRGVDESAGQFGSILTNHRWFEWGWFAAMVASMVILGVAAYCAIFSFPSTPAGGQSEWGFAVDFLKRLLLVSLAGVLVRISLTKYNAERGLRIVYRHRQEILNQYQTFESGIGDSLEAKNQFRLEIVKYIFSDPQSTYLSAGRSSGTDININPVVSAAERLTRTK